MPLRFLFWLSWMWMGLAWLFGFTTTSVSGYVDPSVNPELQDVFIFSTFRTFQIPFANFPIPIPTTSFFSSVGDLLTWNYDIFSGNWNMVRFMILMPISFGATLYIVTALGPVIISLVSAIGNFFRGIIDLLPF